MGRLGLWVTACLGVAACLWVAGCASPGPPRAILDYDGQEGGLQLFVRPYDAEVFVDGDYKGLVSDFQGDRALWLPRGLHAMEVRKEGYHTFFRQFETTLGLLEIMVNTMQPNKDVR